MNVRLGTETNKKDTTVLVSEKLDRLIKKFFTAEEMKTYEKLGQQQIDNMWVGFYLILHKQFDFTAEQLSKFKKEFDNNFEEDFFWIPQYLISDIPQKAELEEALGMTIEELESL